MGVQRRSESTGGSERSAHRRDGHRRPEFDGTVTYGPNPADKAYLGGFAVVDVATREEALEWAARIAAACRCAQEVRGLVPDPAV